MTIAIIDGDIICYQCTYNIWQNRLQDAGIKPDSKGIYKVTLDADGNKFIPPMTREQETKYLKTCWEIFKKKLNDLLEVTYCDEFVMAVKGGSSFRDHMFDTYKGNREQTEEVRNAFVPTIRQLAVHELDAIPCVGYEADDLLRIWRRQANEAGQDNVLCTIDKDLKCEPGLYFNMHKMHWRMETISEHDALYNYYYQLILGDGTDNVPGIQGVGKVGAKRILSGALTDNDFQEAVVGAYIARYQDSWFSSLLANGRMIHLWRYPHDYFNPREWAVVRELLE